MSSSSPAYLSQSEIASVNASAKEAITSYLQLEKSGYAMLVDAPWGAGKTHLIKSILPKESRYVSLNGIASEQEFRRALLKQSLDTTLSDRAEKLADVVGTLVKIPSLGGLAREIVEDNLLAKLPKALVFDDLERATLPPEVLFGLINEYVEHQSHQVVLVANAEKHPNVKFFKKQNEKLIGRKVAITADFEAAFSKFVSALPEGLGRKFFENNCGLARQVFRDAGHQNLRLLRNVLFETAQIIDRIDPEFFEATEAMERLAKTMLALGMALARGDIAAKDIKKRSNVAIATTKDCPKKFAGMNSVFNRHQDGYDIYSHSGSVLSDDLAHELYVTGYVTKDALNNSLHATKQFYPQDPNPLWKRVVHWSRLSTDELELLIDEAKTHLFSETNVQPGPYLHIADGLLCYYEYSELIAERDELRDQVLDAIKRLADTGCVPAADFGHHFGWSDELNGFSYGGFGVTPNEQFQGIVDAMKQAQEKAYQNRASDLATTLLGTFSTDIERFVELIEYRNDGQSFGQTPIFHEVPTETFAKQAIDHIDAGRADWLESAIDEIKQRHGQQQFWEPEKKWLEEVVQQMRAISAARGPSFVGRTRYLLGRVRLLQKKVDDEAE